MTTNVPLPMPNGTRRYVPSGRSLVVPLWTDHEAGEVRDGKVEVPRRLAHAKPHTNERHEFDRLINANIELWTNWLEKKGWKINSRPVVSGPFNPPTEDHTVEGDDSVYWYFVRARFKRMTPLYVGLEDFLEVQRKAKQFGVEPARDPLPYNNPEKEKQDTGWVSPRDWAEKHRQELGIRKEDYLY